MQPGKEHLELRGREGLYFLDTLVKGFAQVRAALGRGDHRAACGATSAPRGTQFCLAEHIDIGDSSLFTKHWNVRKHVDR